MHTHPYTRGTNRIAFSAGFSNQAYSLIVYLQKKLKKKRFEGSICFRNITVSSYERKKFNNNRTTKIELQLLAALIKVQTKLKLVKGANAKASKLYFCSDSKTVLKFIRQKNTRFLTFVAHLINKI